GMTDAVAVHINKYAAAIERLQVCTIKGSECGFLSAAPARFQLRRKNVVDSQRTGDFRQRHGGIIVSAVAVRPGQFHEIGLGRRRSDILLDPRVQTIDQRVVKAAQIEALKNQIGPRYLPRIEVTNAKD